MTCFGNEKDLRLRTLGLGDVFDMFIAREVLPIKDDTFILDDNDRIEKDADILNSNCLDRTLDGFVRGDIIGFVEIAEKRFGIGEEFEVEEKEKEKVDDGGNVMWFATVASKQATKSIGSAAESSVVLGKKGGLGSKGNTVRPFLSNLSVRKDARRSGVGSALVSACEEVVMTWEGGHQDIVLEVEEENAKAMTFYERLGYKSLFSNPACRRFDTSGFLLKQEPVSKVAMRKKLGVNNGKVGNTLNMFQKLRVAVTA